MIAVARISSTSERPRWLPSVTRFVYQNPFTPSSLSEVEPAKLEGRCTPNAMPRVDFARRAMFMTWNVGGHFLGGHRRARVGHSAQENLLGDYRGTVDRLGHRRSPRAQQGSHRRTDVGVDP